MAGAAYSVISPSSRSYDFLWLSLALLFILPIALFLPINAHDYWFYVRIGRNILQTGSVPTVETLSYTYAGTPILEQAWLASVIFWIAHSLGGATLTFLLRAICIAIAYAWIWILMREAGTGARVASLLTILLGFSSSMNWSVRPQMFAYPLFAATLWALWHWQARRAKPMWILPLTTLLWVNSHGSFILAFALMGSALLFGKGDRKQLGVWLGASLLATLANPRGLVVWQFVSKIVNSPSVRLFATEWQPPVNAGWQMNIFFAWLLLFGPLAAFSQRRLSLLEWVWFLGFGWLALSGVRYVIWFMFIMAVLSGPLLTELMKPFARDTTNLTVNPRLNFVFAGIMLLLPLMMLPGVREAWWKDRPPPYDESSTPMKATAWLAAHPDLPGPLFAEFTFSSYLTFALPSRPVWIDNRFHIYPPEHIEKYQAISSARPGWDAFLEEDGINLLLLSLHSQPLLVAAVKGSEQWCEQYRDEDAVIFSRCEPIL
jgi:hypothetical protein